MCKKVLLLAILVMAFQGQVHAGRTKTALMELPLPGFEVDHTRSDLKRPIRSGDSLYNGPIIDTHAHLYPPRERDATVADIGKWELQRIIDLLKKLEVELIIFMPTPNDGIRRNQELGVLKRLMIQDLAPDRIKVFCGSNYITCWMNDAYQKGYKEERFRDILVQLSKDMDSGQYKGVGELSLYHFDKGYGGQHVLMFPPNFNPFLRVMDHVAKKGMWVDLHAEPVDPRGKSYEKAVFGVIEVLFRRNPNLRLIYSHTAMTNPSNTRRMLQRYPNIMMNIKTEKRHQNWKNLEPVVNTQGELYED
ncbi:hypothetical protein ACFLZG_01470, partial [Thermodesulfobacteriota bacterium]